MEKTNCWHGYESNRQRSNEFTPKYCGQTITIILEKKDLYKPFIDPDIDTLDGEDIKVQDYALVAKVYLNAHIKSGVDLVWQLCNHIDKDWRKNDLVTYLVKEEIVANCICPDGCRSMCVGDIIVMGEDLYICSDCG